jgi:hypothetical protein
MGSKLSRGREISSFLIGPALCGSRRRLAQDPFGHLPQLGALDLDAVRAFDGGEGVERDQPGGDLVAGKIVAAGGEDRRLVRATAGLAADEGDTVAATLRGDHRGGRHARLLL